MPQAALTAAGEGVWAKSWDRQRLMGGGRGQPPEPLNSWLARMERDNEDLKRRVSRLEAQAAPAGDWQQGGVGGGWGVGASGADSGPGGAACPDVPGAGQQGLGIPIPSTLVSDARGSALLGGSRVPSSPAAGAGGGVFVAADTTRQAQQAQLPRQGPGAGRPAGSAWSGSAALHGEERLERASGATGGGAEAGDVQRRVQQQWLVEQVHNVMADPHSTAAAGATEDISADAANQVWNSTEGQGYRLGGALQRIVVWTLSHRDFRLRGNLQPLTQQSLLRGLGRRHVRPWRFLRRGRRLRCGGTVCV